jgi:hypothetical protein
LSVLLHKTTACTAGYGQCVNNPDPGCCVICDNGKYDAGNLHCWNCPAGRFNLNDQIAHTSCKICASGKYSTAGSTECTFCSVGRYNDQNTQANCARCQPGSFTNSTGMTVCSSCSPGLYSAVVNASECSECTTGTFAEAPGSSACKSCVTSTFQNLTGQSFCYDCDVVFEVSPSGSSSCTYCNYTQGLLRNSNKSVSQCSNCGAGDILEIFNPLNLSCIHCPPGFYSQNTSSTVCNKCHPGTYQPNVASSTCFSCPKGTYSSFFSSTSCQKCVGGTTEGVGSLDESYCVICEEGYFGSPPNNPCAKCPLTFGISCPAGSYSPNVASGYWRISLTSILKCSPPAACQFTGVQNMTTCSKEYKGTNCGECNFDHYRLGLECKKCPAVWVQVLTIFAFILIFLAISFRLTFANGKLSPDVRIAIQSIQIISLYTAITPNWPPYIKSLINVFSLTVSNYALNLLFISIRISISNYLLQSVHSPWIFGRSIIPKCCFYQLHL